MNTYPWIEQARAMLGQKEIPGAAKANPKIVELWKKSHIELRVSDDSETPWCATFVCACLEAVNIKSTRSAWARNFETWGRRLLTPRVGCIVVFRRNGGGHVGFVVGQDQRGNLMVLGGNQSDAVNIKPFDTARVTAFVWPKDVDLPAAGPLPVVKSDGKLSTNEQ
jgi:uncharacterized protein (TIGR02594 family)